MNLEAQIREAVIKDIRYPKNRPYSRLYDIDEKLVAKVEWLSDNAKKEFEIGKFLYQNEIQVPQFHDLIHLSDFYEDEDSSNYIVMDKIEGPEGLELKGHIKELAVGQLLVEVEKIFDLGINPMDCEYPSNAIFNFEENKLYLIDFGQYEFIEEPGNRKKMHEDIKEEIDNYYGNIAKLK